MGDVTDGKVPIGGHRGIIEVDVQKEIAALDIGTQIRRLRLREEKTLQDVSTATGLSKPQLSQIENNVSAPPIATLMKISKALDVDIGHFFQSTDSPEQIDVVRAEQRVRSIRRRDHNSAAITEYTYESLAPPKASRHMEPFLVEIQERPSKDLVLVQHQGEEFIFILEGTVEFRSEDQTITLEPQDSLYFDSTIPHAFRSLSGGPAKVLSVVYAENRI